MKRKRQPYSRYSKKIKLEAIRRVLVDEQPVQEVVADLGIRHRDNVYEWIKKYKKDGPAAFERSIRHKDTKEEHDSIEEQVAELKLEVEALKTCLLYILQEDEEKYKAIQILKHQYPIDLLCKVFDVPKVEFLEYRQRVVNS